MSIFACISRVASSGDTEAYGYGREDEDLQHVVEALSWRRGVVRGSQLGELSELCTEGTWEGFMSLVWRLFDAWFCFDVGLHNPQPP